MEVILPPVDDIEQALTQILEPFNENGEDDYGERKTNAFWDWYVIGGRWAGAKLEAGLDTKQKDLFFAELNCLGITVSGLTAGKQELKPASQIPIVDALWNQHFPDSPLKVCPFFKHFNDQYKNSDGFPDIMRLLDIPHALQAERVIIAGPRWNDASRLEAVHMIAASIWNGVNHVDSRWDGEVRSAIDGFLDKLKNYKPEYAAKHTPQPDWLVVTVDYHS